MMSKFFSRINLITRNSLILIPNLFKGDIQIKLYILNSWFINNINYLNPIKKRLENFILYLRVKNSKKKSSVTINSIDLDFICKVDIFYINLLHRTDRKAEILNEFQKLGINNFTRFNAVKSENGALGCAISHKTILENWDTHKSPLLLICEDDVTFTGDREELADLLFNFYIDDNLDVLCLGFNNFNCHSYNEKFNITSDTQTLSCYVIKPRLKNILITTFVLSIKLLDSFVDRQYGTAVDIVWKSLQKKYIFVIPKKRFAYQRDSYSDIENAEVSYKV